MMLDPVERLLRVSKALVDRGKSTKAEELRAVLLATKKKKKRPEEARDSGQKHLQTKRRARALCVPSQDRTIGRP